MPGKFKSPMDAASAYLQAGLSVIPAWRDKKSPALPTWKPYQQKHFAPEDVTTAFGQGDSIAIITGKVSGNLEMLDFDQKAEFAKTWGEIVEAECPGLVSRLVAEQSQSDGVHIVYRCPMETIPGSITLASRGFDVTDAVHAQLTKLGVDPGDQGKVKDAFKHKDIKVDIGGKERKPFIKDGSFWVVITYIETRGEGGYFLAAPSPGYKLFQGDFTAIPVVTAAERQVMLNVAKSLNEWGIEAHKVFRSTIEIPQAQLRPGDEFNAKADLLQMLLDEGWEKEGAPFASGGKNLQHMRRPGKTGGISATLYDGKLLHVFSSNAHPFVPGENFDAFACFALFKHGGDFAAAAGELGKQGYGQPPVPEKLGKGKKGEPVAGKMSLAPCRFIEGVPEAPVAPDVMVPLGYLVDSQSGVQLVDSGASGEEKVRQLSFAPVVLVKRLINVQTGHEDVLIAWSRDASWKFQVVDKETIASSRKIITLANSGLPVDSTTSTRLVGYFSAYEAQNRDLIPITAVTNILGWQGDMNFFMAGNKLISCDNIMDANASALGIGNWSNAAPVVFKGKDAGDEQLAEAFSSKGSLVKWAGAINELYDYPFAVTIFLGGFAPQLLQILGAPNFAIDNAFTSSRGKTTILRCVTSIWGDPTGVGATLLHTWDNTDVWIGRAAATLNDLPLILDDTKLAGGGNKQLAASKVSSTLYKIASGRDRGRGSLEGTRATDTWRTVLLSTGEQSAVDFTTGDGGTRARVISLWAAPFGEGDSSEFVNRLTNLLRDNFGHAGPRFVQFILANREDWNLWRGAFQQLKTFYAKKAQGNPVAVRISEHFATLAMTAALVHAALPELQPAQPIRDILDAAWNATQETSIEADCQTASKSDPQTAPNNDPLTAVVECPVSVMTS
jgi:hypothetical protein